MEKYHQLNVSDALLRILAALALSRRIIYVSLDNENVELFSCHHWQENVSEHSRDKIIIHEQLAPKNKKNISEKHIHVTMENGNDVRTFRSSEIIFFDGFIKIARCCVTFRTP